MTWVCARERGPKMFKRAGGVVSRYCWIWIGSVGLLSIVGVMLALELDGPDLTAGIGLMAGAVAGSIRYNVAWRRGERPAEVSTVPVAACAAAIVVALCGFTAWIGAESLGLVLVVVVTCPPVYAWLTGMRR